MMTVVDVAVISKLRPRGKKIGKKEGKNIRLAVSRGTPAGPPMKPCHTTKGCYYWFVCRSPPGTRMNTRFTPPTSKIMTENFNIYQNNKTNDRWRSRVACNYKTATQSEVWLVVLAALPVKDDAKLEATDVN